MTFKAANNNAYGLGLRLGVSAFALIASCGVAVAQEAPADEESDAAIVVTGIRASATKSIETKRNAEVLVDSISAEDIGALPDRSVSEALQRIPGVTLQRTNENRDPARLAAEGGGVFIRGLSWVRSETNGRDVFSANNGRGLSFEDIPADLLMGVDVYKNPSADMIEGGVGGLVNLRTRKPFDAPGQVIAGSADYNYADLRKKGYWSGNALYSNRWKLGGGEIGILLSGSINNIGNRTDSIQLGRYAPIALTAPQDGLATGTTTFVPASLGWRRIDWQQRRTALDGIVQIAPSDNMTFTFEAIYARATPRDIERALGVYELPNESSSYQYDDQNVLISGESPNANLQLDTRFGSSEKETQDFSINWKWEATDNLTISLDAQRVYSTAKMLSMTAFTQFGAQQSQRPDLSFDLSGDSPSVSLAENGASLATQSNYWWAAAMDHIEDNTAGSWAERADIEYRFDDDSFFKSFRAGVRATDKEAITRQTGYNWSLLSSQYWGGGAPVYLDQTGSPANAGLPSQSDLYSYDNFFRGKIAVPGVGWFPSESLVSNGTANAYSFLRSTETAGWGWSPLTEASYDSARPGADNVSGGISRQNEKTLAGYGLLRFGSEGSLRFDGNIGLRVIETKNVATGLLTISPLQGALPLSSCVSANGAAACAALAEAYAFIGSGQGITNYQFNNKYTDVLPSLNLRFFLQDRLLLRLAAAKAIVRPNFAQMVPYNSLSFSFQTDGFTPSLVNARTGTGGNPFLKPTKANQFDASLEYYYGRSNALTFAAFYKDVKDYIFLGNQPETYTANGTTVTFDVTRNVNGAKGTVWGFEAGWQQFFDFLPGALSGLGVQTNFTFVESSGGRNTAVNTLDSNQTGNAADQTLPLEGMSKYAFNVAAVYEKYGISARLAYNWRSGYLLTTSAANLNVPTWSEDYGQLDGSIVYSLNQHLKVGVQVTNLLNARTFLDVGGNQLHPRYSWTDTDRRIAFLVRTRF